MRYELSLYIRQIKFRPYGVYLLIKYCVFATFLQNFNYEFVYKRQIPLFSSVYLPLKTLNFMENCFQLICCIYLCEICKKKIFAPK